MNQTNKSFIYVFSGGTVQHISPHFAVCAPAYGKIGKDIALKFISEFERNPQYKQKYKLCSFHTRMTGDREHKPHEASLLEEAGLKYIETNEDMDKIINVILSRQDTKGIIMAAALCDFTPYELTTENNRIVSEFGKDQPRLSSKGNHALYLKPTEKLIDQIKDRRGDVFLVSFKTTAGDSKEVSYHRAKDNLKRSNSNLVFINDIVFQHNGIVTPKAFYWGENRDSALAELAEITMQGIELI